MSQKPVKNQFNGGELSPWLAGRVDIAKYHQTAKVCRNFIPLTEGALKRRGGTRFVAQTPETEAVYFEICAKPVEARVLINSVEQNKIYAAVGDTVFYEVRAQGYETLFGEMKVEQNTTLEVDLVTLSPRLKFTIEAAPDDCVVKIEGYERTSYDALMGQKLNYLVYKDGYKLQKGEAVINEDTTLNICLTADDEKSFDYGNLGKPLGFLGASVVCGQDVYKKCFMFRFTNGYLPVLFKMEQVAPLTGDFDESLFLYFGVDGYNACCFDKNNCLQPAVLWRNQDGIFYENIGHVNYWGFDLETLKFTGWPIDGQNKYVSFFDGYDAVKCGDEIKIYFNGKPVWILGGRDNG